MSKLLEENEELQVKVLKLEKEIIGIKKFLNARVDEHNAVVERLNQAEDFLEILFNLKDKLQFKNSREIKGAYSNSNSSYNYSSSTEIRTPDIQISQTHEKWKLDE